MLTMDPSAKATDCSTGVVDVVESRKLVSVIYDVLQPESMMIILAEGDCLV